MQITHTAHGYFVFHNN